MSNQCDLQNYLTWQFISYSQNRGTKKSANRIVYILNNEINYKFVQFSVVFNYPVQLIRLLIINLTNMSYIQRSSIEEPLKNSQKVNSTNFFTQELQIPNSSYLKSFKKTMGHQINKGKPDSTHLSFSNDENSRVQKQNQRNKTKSKNKNQLDHLQFVMQQTDNSMEELLNSSINQFQRLIINEESGQSLEEQNHRLKNALYKMKNILRDKLEIALQKQKEELSKMLEDYISLITKLLQDKQQLTIKIQDLAEQNQKKLKQVEAQFEKKLKCIQYQRDEQIGSTKNQIEEFLSVILQYEEETKQEQIKFNQMQERITELQQEKQSLIKELRRDKKGDHFQHDDELSIRLEAQSTKIQTLLQLLQKSQQQNSQLKTQINKLKNRDHSIYPNDHLLELKSLKEEYQRRIEQIQIEHQQQFLEYQKAIKDTLSKKQECIERLNLIIENLRQRRPAH